MIQRVREKFCCRAYRTVTPHRHTGRQISRARTRQRLLAYVPSGKYRLHLPSTGGARPLRVTARRKVSTLTDWVSRSSCNLDVAGENLTAHILAGGRIRADDTTAPVLAKGKTRAGRL
ncbi:IS66 family transposase [Bradyrhizobium oligotrophicum]|uniref:IS66 family transposase n=1 Tax=Bradyrhizobium oligotrophicum TaxID=44255 RepID=UPI003EBB3BB6